MRTPPPSHPSPPATFCALLHLGQVAMALHSANTFRDVIEPTTGLSNIGWYRTGSLGLARSEGQLHAKIVLYRYSI